MEKLNTNPPSESKEAQQKIFNKGIGKIRGKLKAVENERDSERAKSIGVESKFNDANSELVRVKA